MDPVTFVATYGSLADQAAAATGLSRWTVLSQWAFETGWADPNSGVPFNNLAGIRDMGRPQNWAGFAIYDSLEQFVGDYVAVLQQANMASVLAAAGQGPDAELGAFAGAAWVGYDPAADAHYAAQLQGVWRSVLAPLSVPIPPPSPPPVVPPSPSPSGGLSSVDRDFLYAQVVKIAHATGVTLDTPPWVPPATRTYTVKPGDYLSLIAQQYLGDGNRWSEIYDLNKAEIGPDPNLIHPGQVLVLPSQ